MSRALEEAAEWIVRLNDADATERDFAEWQAWMTQDSSHAAVFQDLQDTWRRSASVAQICMPETAARSDEFTAIPFLSRLRERVGVRAFLSLAAAAVLAIALTIFLRPTSQTLQTATTELRSLKLADGTRVSLGPETRLDIAFSRHKRLIDMRGGEAYFDIAPAPDKPFSVRTSAGLVTALGTAFSIRSDADRLAVSVTEGSVQITSSSLPRAAEGERKDARVIAAGQKYVRAGAHAQTTTLSSLASATAWQERRLEYQAEPLSAVVADINRYSRIKVRIGDPALGNLRYTGTVFPDTLDAWLMSIQGVFPLQVREAADERRLVPSN